jgi:hypothetical protein
MLKGKSIGEQLRCLLAKVPAGKKEIRTKEAAACRVQMIISGQSNDS